MIRSLLGPPLRIEWKTAVMTVAVTLLIMVDRYFALTPWKSLDRFIFYLLVPLVITLLVFREAPDRYGFALGDWKAGIAITLIAWLLLAPILYFAARTSAMREYYAWQLQTRLPLWLLLELAAWEYIFRGWLIQGYGRQFGSSALWLQAVPFALAHLGKPALETLSTIFGGFAVGWVAWRTRSFIYSFLIHYFVTIFTVLAAAGVFG